MLNCKLFTVEKLQLELELHNFQNPQLEPHLLIFQNPQPEREPEPHTIQHPQLKLLTFKIRN